MQDQAHQHPIGQFFTLTTHYHDLYAAFAEEEEDTIPPLPDDFREFEFTGESLGQDLVERGFTYRDVHGLVDGHTVLWLTRQAYVMGTAIHENYNDYFFWEHPFSDTGFPFRVRSANNQEWNSLYIKSSSREELIAVGDILVRLLLNDEPREVVFGDYIYIRQLYAVALPVSAPVLSRLLTESQPLTRVKFDLTGHEEFDRPDAFLRPLQLRAIGAVSRQGLEIEITRNHLNREETAALADVLRGNQGETCLNLDEVTTDDWEMLFSGLIRNRTVKGLRVRFGGRGDNSVSIELAVRVFASIIAENLGLVRLDMFVGTISDAAWVMLFQSLRFHFALETMILETCGLLPASMNLRTRAVCEMLETNEVIHTITLTEASLVEGHIRYDVLPHDVLAWQTIVQPRLTVNRYRPRVREIEQVPDDALRAKLLARVLQSPPVNSNPTLVHMFLSVNRQALLTYHR